MTEQYEKIYKDIIQKRILNDEFDVETFKKRRKNNKRFN